MRSVAFGVWLVAGLCLFPLAAGAAAPQITVVSSIKPLQLLVTAIGGDSVDSRALLPVDASPHHFQLRPSDVRQLRDARLVFWVGPELERFLARSLSALPQAVMLMEPPGAGSALRKPSADREHDHSHTTDPHIWLGLDEIERMAVEIEAQLASILPARSGDFRRDREQLLRQLRELDAELAIRLLPLREKRYLLIHEGFGYFERRYGIAAAAVVSPVADHPPGTRHVNALRKRLQNGEFDCVFSERQLRPALLDALLRGVAVPVFELDPIGADAGNHSQGFVDFYRQLGERFAACAQLES